MTVGNEEFLRDLYNVKYLFGDKWAPAIIVALANGKMRRATILSTINSYSIGEEWSNKHTVLHDSILARTLKKMTGEGLLVRTRSVDIFPPRVYYSLAPEIAEFLRVVGPLVRWARRYPGLIAHAQAYSRHHGGDVDDMPAIAELVEVRVGPGEDAAPERSDLIGSNTG